MSRPCSPCVNHLHNVSNNAPLSKGIMSLIDLSTTFVDTRTHAHARAHARTRDFRFVVSSSPRAVLDGFTENLKIVLSFAFHRR